MKLSVVKVKVSIGVFFHADPYRRGVFGELHEKIVWRTMCICCVIGSILQPGPQWMMMICLLTDCYRSSDRPDLCRMAGAPRSSRPDRRDLSEPFRRSVVAGGRFGPTEAG